MSTDRELLELAAKAAGPGVWLEHDDRPWNPLTDDGDALRLAVNLGMNLDFVNGNSGAQLIGVGFFSEPHNSYPYAATRRAIVRAAAEIGRAAS